MAQKVTGTDRAIVRLLQRDARISYAELSRATGIPESTVRRRMDRLLQRGVIEFAVVADPGKLGYELRAMIGLKVELPYLDQITAQLQAMHEVTFATFVTGSFDIIIEVIVRSQEGLVEFLAKRLATITGVRSSETFIMPYILKPATAWVLPEADTERLTLSDNHVIDDAAEPRPQPRQSPSGRGRRTRRQTAAVS